jgi:broad specificity phosphatase PhoE
MEIYLVRHGQSWANAYGLVTGTPEDELTPTGAREAKQLGRFIQLSGVSFSECFVSPWRRARQTAQLLTLGERFEIVEEIGETDAGEVKDWTLAQFHARFPEFTASFVPERRYPGGESHLELYQRVTRWIRELAEETHDEAGILVVTHNGPIACILHFGFGLSLDRFPQFIAGNGSVSILRVPNTGKEPSGWVLKGFGIKPGLG